jgi:hypothetical protein
MELFIWKIDLYAGKKARWDYGASNYDYDASGARYLHLISHLISRSI